MHDEANRESQDRTDVRAEATPHSWATPERPDRPIPPSPAPLRKSSQGWGARALTASFLALVLIGAGIGMWWGLDRSGMRPRADHRAKVAGEVRAIARRVEPGVVDVNTFTTGMAPVGGQPVAEGAGTGMVLTPSGEVLTNNHVIQGATLIKVFVPGHQEALSATVVGADPTADVALLQIQGVSGLRTVATGTSSSLRVGQRVIAIGNALGRGGTPAVTQGAVSGLDRSIKVPNGHGDIEHLTGLVQSDARISPGDSGGTLVNSSGQVVGIVTAAATRTPSQRSSREGYAIPIDSALGIANQIRAGHARSEIVLGLVGYLW